jgi:hypothetical protein
MGKISKRRVYLRSGGMPGRCILAELLISRVLGRSHLRPLRSHYSPFVLGQLPKEAPTHMSLPVCLLWDRNE